MLTAQASLIHAEKMASLGHLTAGIAHEIKNPLNFVNNFSLLSVELLDELKETAAAGFATLDDDVRVCTDETIRMLNGEPGKIAEHGRRAMPPSLVMRRTRGNRTVNSRMRPVRFLP